MEALAKSERSDGQPLEFPDFFRGFIQYAALNWVKTFPQPKDQIWHEFLYYLARATQGLPNFIRAVGEFDYVLIEGILCPRCRNFKDFLDHAEKPLMELPSGRAILKPEERWDKSKRKCFFKKHDYAKIYDLARGYRGLFRY